MSWLYSIIFASLVFSSEGSLPIRNFNLTDGNVKQVVQADETERFEQTYPLNANGKVSVSNINGSITVETWDSPQVKLQYVKTGGNKESLSQVDINIEARQEAFRVETDYGSYNDRKQRGYGSSDRLQVEYRLTVPRTAVLDEIETVNGSINISNAANTTKASAVNGQIKATNLRGTTNLSTVNGTVEADFDQLQKGSKISLDTVNGTVNLTIPSDADAILKADTVNGKIDNDFGLPVRKGKYVGKDLYGRIGSGDVLIKLSSVNGELSMKRKNDGKNVNSATDLLPVKNGNDDEDDDGFSVPAPPNAPRSPRPPRTPRPPFPPVFDGSAFDAETQKQVEQALKEAEKEIGKITPEMQKQIEESIKQANAAIKVKEFSVKEMQEQIKLAQEKYREAAARMSNAFLSPNIEKKSESFAVKGVPKVTIEADHGAVSVRGWDKSEVQYFVTRISRTSAQKPLDFKAEQNGQDISIKVADGENAAGFNESNSVRLEIYVPKKSNLKIVTGGEIRLEGITGEIDLSGADSAINVRDAGGKIQIASNDGEVRVIGFRGEIEAKSIDGGIAMEGDFQKLSAQTADGTIILTLPESSNVNIESNRQDITADGIALTRSGTEKNNYTWKVGGGGANHRLSTTSDGQIFIRSAGIIKAN